MIGGPGGLFLRTTANYGTNGNAIPERPETAPERSDTILVTSYGYDRAGNQNRTTDPAGRVTLRTFDAARRELTAISNYVATSSSEVAAGVCCAPCGSPDAEPELPCPGESENVTLRMAYNADGNWKRYDVVNAHLELTHFVPSRIDPPGLEWVNGTIVLV